MSDYPGAIDEFREKENLPGHAYDATKKRALYVEDLTALETAIVAIQTVLGLDPQGSYDTVKDWLTDLGTGGGGAWGSITGTLSDQTDLQTALDGKQASLGFTPENVANKATTMSGNTASNTLYLTAKAIYDWAVATFQSALGFTPENVANKQTDLTASATKYPTVNAVNTGLALKQDSLGYTAENTANKKLSLVDNSDTYYPSQKAVKTAVDAKQDSLGYTAENTANKDTDTSLSANSDTKYPSQKAIKTYADAIKSNVDNLLTKITVSGSNVGINSGSPGEALEVIGTRIFTKPDATWSSGDTAELALGDTNGYIRNVFGTGMKMHANGSIEFYTEFTTDFIFYGSSTEIARLTSAGQFLLKNNNALGYGTGSGSTVTQSTSKTNGVTINNVCGAITMNNAALAGGAEAEFTVTNSKVASTDVVVVCVASGATASTYQVTVSAVGSGSFKILVSNASTTSRSEAIVINFAVIKAVTS